MTILMGALLRGSSKKSGKNPKGASGNNTPKSRSTPLMDGAWCWFGDPRGVYYNGNVYAGSITQNGSVLAVRWPDGDGMDQSFVLKAEMEQDDHDNPSLLIRDSDRRILVWYSQHGGATIYQRISTNVEDVSAWGAESSLDASLGGTAYTYPNPIQLLGEVNDPIYLFYRDTDVGGAPSDHYVTFSKSTDGGATWAAQTQLINVTYAKIALNGDDRIDIVVGNNPGDAIDHGVYHCYYQGGNYYQSDGTQIVAGLPFSVGDMTQVYDGSVTIGWIWDIAIDGSGNPVVIYCIYDSYPDGTYYYAKWTGLAWDSHAIVASESFWTTYLGGAVLDHDDVNTVYVSIGDSGVFEVWKYTTADGGTSWSTEQLASGHSANQIQVRPFVIRDHASDTLLWMSGKYDDYNNYKTDIVRR